MDELVSAGASSLAEYERRRSVHRENIRRRRPLILGMGGILAVIGIALIGAQPLLGWALLLMAIGFTVNTLVVLPNHITAWATGADGEARTARLLEPLRAEGFAVLHDRRIPG